MHVMEMCSLITRLLTWAWSKHGTRIPLSEQAWICQFMYCCGKFLQGSLRLLLYTPPMFITWLHVTLVSQWSLFLQMNNFCGCLVPEHTWLQYKCPCFLWLAIHSSWIFLLFICGLSWILYSSLVINEKNCNVQSKEFRCSERKRIINVSDKCFNAVKCHT